MECQCLYKTTIRLEPAVLNTLPLTRGSVLRAADFNLIDDEENE